MPASHGRIEGNYKPILPCGRRVLLRPTESPDYQGKIILPDSVKTMVPTTGTILALGFDLEEGNPFKEGDSIVFSKYAGIEFTYGDGTRVQIVHEDDIVGIQNSTSQVQEATPA